MPLPPDPGEGSWLSRAARPSRLGSTGFKERFRLNQFRGSSVAVEQPATVPARRHPARQRAVFVDERQTALDAFHQAGVDGQQQLT